MDPCGSKASKAGGGGSGGGISGESRPFAVCLPLGSVGDAETVGFVAWRSASNASKNSIFCFSFSSTESFLVLPGILLSILQFSLPDLEVDRVQSFSLRSGF